MPSPPNTDVSNLEAEYIRVKVTLYKNLFLYCAVITLIIISKETFRAIYFARTGIFVVLLVFFGFGSFLSYFIWRLKNNQELTITVYLAVFFLSALLAQYYTKSGYFDNPLDCFNFAYAYAVCERIIMARISKFSHRIGFISFITVVRVFTIPAGDTGLFLMQFVYLAFTIFLDFDKEKYDKEFFKSYFRNKEQLLKFKNLLVQDIPESILIITQDLIRPLFVNNSFEELVGTSSTLNVRNKLRQFILQEGLEDSQPSSQISTSNSSSVPKQTLLAFLESTVYQSKSLSSQMTQKFSCNLCYKKTGETNEESQEYMFEAKALHLLWDDEPAIVVILHDITQQHTILSLKIADAHKDTILATVSHELRTPLNGIIGMIQIMQKRVLDSEMMKYLSICRNSGDLLLSLVNSILDLNQIRAKKLKLCLESVKLSEILDGIVRLFELQCSQKGLYLKLNVAANCPAYLVTDKSRLSQIFINLVGNALKFTRHGGITISANYTSGTDSLTFNVEDTGTGIRDEDKTKLFTMFGKLEQSDRHVNPHGVGLGLTISDKLVRILKSDGEGEGIQLDSVYGKGSKFTFSIKKNLRENNDNNLNNGSSGELFSERIKREFEEKGDVQMKMENYSKQFVKNFARFTSLNTTLPTHMDDDHGHARVNFNKLSLTTNSYDAIPPTQNPMSNFCVLIVDDNPLNIIIAERFISSHGYQVKTALYGQTAIDIVLNCNYAVDPIKLILMDCQMPVMDGFMVTKLLKKMMSEKKIPEIPIVALTANDSEADREASRKAGMCEHMTKPLKENILSRILSKYML